MILTPVLWLTAAIAVAAGVQVWRRIYRKLSNPARWWTWFLSVPGYISVILFCALSVADFGWWTTLSRTFPILLTIVALANPLFVWHSMRWWSGLEYLVKDQTAEVGRQITKRSRRIEREVREFRKSDRFPRPRSDSHSGALSSSDKPAINREQDSGSKRL